MEGLTWSAFQRRGKTGDTAMADSNPETKKPVVGIRFLPTDVELVVFYLKRKVAGKHLYTDIISEIEIYKHEPWELAALSTYRSTYTSNSIVYFFTTLDDKQPRTTESGYWEVNGEDSVIQYRGSCVGVKRTLIFHRGRPPQGERTDWVMHEYSLGDTPNNKEGSYVICKVFNTGASHENEHLQWLTSDDDEPAKSHDPPVSCGEEIASEHIQLDLESDSDSVSDSCLSELLQMLQTSEIESYETSMPDISSTTTSSSGQSVSMSLSTHTGGQAEPKMFADGVNQLDSIYSSDAWKLFRRQVGDIIYSPEIKPCAKLVVDKCGYSPVLISAVGSALTGESNVEEWLRAALIPGFPKAGDKDDSFIIPHIEYCLDRLKAQNVKTCFLYCALLLDNKAIHASALAKCIIEEGLIKGMTMVPYTKAKDIVGQLIKASLLEANDKTMMVKMHNVIRKSALTMLSSSSEGRRMLARSDLSQLGAEQGDVHSDKYLIKVDAQPKEPPPLIEWEQATRIILTDNQLSSLPNKPHCPKLASLYLQRNPYLRVIPTDFFNSMSSLNVLNLSETRIRSLPDSLRQLTRLQSFYMRDCDHLITLPSAIGQLIGLEELDLKGTKLLDLPESFRNLVNLRSLQVSFYGSVNYSEYKGLPTKIMEAGTIVSFPKLKELGLFVHPGDRRWTADVSNITREIINLALISIYFHFCTIENLRCFLRGNRCWLNSSVIEFNFIVGHDFKRAVSLVTKDAESLHNEFNFIDVAKRCLRFVNGKSIPNEVVEVLKRATSFYLDHHLEICYLSEFGIDNMGALRICILSDCPNILAIIHQPEEEDIILPCLEYLSINSLYNLKSTIIGDRAIGKGSFDMLKCLSFRSCPNLRFLFTYSMVKVLSNLEELVIDDCASLEYFVIQDDTAGEFSDNALDQLHLKANKGESAALHNLKVLKLHHTPNMLGFGGCTWPSIEYMSFYDCPKLKNLGLTVNDVMNVKEIAAEKAWFMSLEWDEPELAERLGELYIY